MDYPQRKRLRLEGYDYSREGAYFITICSHKRLPILGTIKDEQIQLNCNGIIVHNSWISLPEQYPSVCLDEFVVMPNHFHAIVCLTENHAVGVRFPDPPHAKIKPAVGAIIAYFKYITTKRINMTLNSAGQRRWQRNYYEHIIRNDDELSKIRDYIQNNPLKWRLDKYYYR